MTKEADTVLIEGGNNQRMVYLSRRLELPKGWKQGTKLSVKVVGDTITISKK